jgi:hypothetical protein
MTFLELWAVTMHYETTSTLVALSFITARIAMTLSASPFVVIPTLLDRITWIKITLATSCFVRLLLACDISQARLLH